MSDCGYPPCHLLPLCAYSCAESYASFGYEPKLGAVPTSNGERHRLGGVFASTLRLSHVHWACSHTCWYLFVGVNLGRFRSSTLAILERSFVLPDIKNPFLHALEDPKGLWR